MKKLLLVVTVLIGLAGQSLAGTVEQQVLGSLAAQGYVIIEKGYTFLGRLRIVAENDKLRREIVVNPGTGEILRDYAVTLPRRATPAEPDPSPPVANLPPRSAPAPAFTATDGIGDDDNAAASLGTTSAIVEENATPPDVTNIFQGLEDEFRTDTGPIELILPESILQMDAEAP